MPTAYKRVYRELVEVRNEAEALRKIRNEFKECKLTCRVAHFESALEKAIAYSPDSALRWKAFISNLEQENLDVDD